MKKILLIDNYDSFTYNLVHYIEDIIGYSITVIRNDKININIVDEFDIVVISPGPGLPEESGIIMEVIKKYSSSKIIFGICLGMQAIAINFGAKLQNLKKVYHGVATAMTITDKNDMLFKGIPDSFKAGRYHSWIVDSNSLPDELQVTCVDDKERIMAIKHKSFNVSAVQFHPESILTEHGKKIIYNFLYVNEYLFNTILFSF